ncbi:epsin-1 isoform X2 [Channa argus]
MTSSMLRRQLKNLVQNYSEAEVKVREATSNDPWGPSSSQMADISDLTYNVVACNEIMTMLWKRLKDDKNWRHIHKSLTLLEYLLKTGDDRVLLKMKDNIYIVKALTEYRFVEKDGKDQGANVREKAKVVLVLMEDDDKLKEERDLARITREKTSKSSAASSSDVVKDTNYKPCYVPGATGLPSIDNIPSVADLTASFAARKEERLRQEAEKKEAERRAKMTEDELKWEDAGKGNGIKDSPWGGLKEEKDVKPDPWGAPKEPIEATDSWGTPSRPDTTETAASSDPWGDASKTDEDSFSAPKTHADPFAAPKTDEDPFAAPKNGGDPFAAPKDEPDPFSATQDDRFNTSKDSSDPFSAPKDKEDPFSAPKDKPDPFSSSTNDPFITPKDDPFSTSKNDPFSTPKEDPFFAPKGDPFNSAKEDPFNSPKEDPFNTLNDYPFAAPASTPPKEDPFAVPASTKDDPFTDATSPTKNDPFSLSSKPTRDDPFAAPRSQKKDPFSAPTKDDPFTAPTTPPKNDTFAVLSSPPQDTSGPFSAPPVSLPQAGADAWEAPATSPPAADSDPWEITPALKEAKSDDPWGNGASASSAVDNTDPFGDTSKLDNDPWGAPAAAPVSADDMWGAPAPPSDSSPCNDPFGDGVSKASDPWGAPCSKASNGTGKQTAQEEEMCRKATLFLGSTGASLVDLDDLFSSNPKPKQCPLTSAPAVQAQAIGTFKARGITSGPMIRSGTVAGVSLPETSALLSDPFCSTMSTTYGTPSPMFGAASTSTNPPRFQLPAPTMGGLNMFPAVQMAPLFSGTGIGQSVCFGESPQMGLNVKSPSGGAKIVQSGPLIGNPIANPLLAGTGMAQPTFFGGNPQAGVAHVGGSTAQAAGGVPLQLQLVSASGSNGTAKKSNNPFLL